MRFELGVQRIAHPPFPGENAEESGAEITEAEAEAERGYYFDYLTAHLRDIALATKLAPHPQTAYSHL